MTGFVSSRTPEGESNHCPICNQAVWIEPSQPTGDAPCPNCGKLLWFYSHGNESRLHDQRSINTLRERLYAILANRLAVDDERLNDETSFARNLRVDSLDTVELIMELEEQLDINIPDDEAEKIQTIADLLDYLGRQRG